MVTVNTGKIRLKKRIAKLEKGEKILDIAFNPYAKGVTRFSLAVWENCKKHIDMNGFTQAKMEYAINENYADRKLTLTHKAGWKIVLHGVSSGYSGEGSRGSKKILEECGFSRPERVFNRNFETFTFKRKTV